MRKRKSAPRTKVLWVGALIGVIILGTGTVLWLNATHETESLAQTEEREVIYPVQYSDTHITYNAIATDPRFKHIAIPPQSSFVAALLSSMLLGPSSRNLTSDSSEQEHGSWLWTPLLMMTPEYTDSIIAGAKENGIRNLYLSLDSYLDIYILPNGPEKTAKRKVFDDMLAEFISKANASGITVDAEGGWRNWTEKGNVYKPLALLEYVKEFNATHSEKLRGFQYDIEPYLLDYYPDNKKGIFNNYLDLMSETVTQLDNTDLLFSVVIPDFYDDRREIPQFFYGLRYGFVLDHLFGILKRRPGSKIIVMAYRNYSDGRDGSIEISRGEIEKSERFDTRVVIAQETGEVLPPSITFHNTSRAHLDKEVENIRSAFADHKGYDGIAIHYINALMALK